MRRLTTTLLILLVAGATAWAAEEGYKLLKTVPIPGDGGWDYVTVDDTGRRVYVSHSTEVVVLDADSYDVKGKVADLKGVHGIAVAPEFDRGFISNGRADNVTVFELKTLKTVGTVDTGKNPDCIIYDPATKRVFAFNGRSGSTTAIQAEDSKVAGTLDLGGRPEFAVADGTGSVFVNLEDKDTIVKFDAKKLEVQERWPLAPGKEPSGLAMDRKNRRLFSGCGNKTLVILNADDGKVVTTQPIGQGVDAAAFDPETGLVFASCRDGTVTVVREDGPDKYTAVETVKTRTGSKTMGLDPKTHRLFLPGADFKPNPDNPNGRPMVVPGSFVVMVYGK
jgi:DNA-binding beta-propeller fold protein YncE